MGKNLIELHNGKTIFKYSGRGLLELKDGQKLNCKFEIDQLSNGDILLVCNQCEFQGNTFTTFDNSLSRAFFTGTTSKSFQVSGEGFLKYGHSSSKEKQLEYSLKKLTVHMYKNKTEKNVHFGITNFEFMGDKSNNKILTLDLEAHTSVSIRKLETYQEIIKHIETFNSVDVTCEAIINLEGKTIECLEKRLDNLLYAMSIAWGTKIQWIYYEIYDDKENCISRVHSPRVTKAYSSHKLIDINDPHATKVYIENADRIFVEKKELVKPMRELIDSYLDSLVPGIYLETKGAQLAVTMEMLKTIFIKTDNRNKGTIIEKEKFKELQAIIEEWINSNIKESQTTEKEENKNNDAKKWMRQNINSLNRKPFKALISDFCKEINYGVDEDQIQLFVRCRNKLVHTGNFYCRTANSEDKEKYPQLKSELSEYYFLVNFISKLILKMFGYSGIYFDWSDIEGPIRKELM